MVAAPDKREGDNMNRFEAEVVIDRPIADVWGYLNTPENELVWQSSAVERSKVTEGPLEKGGRTRGVDTFLGRRLTTEWEMLELHDYERRERTVSGPFEMEIDWRLEPVGDSTRMVMAMSAEAGAGGFFGRFADPVILRMAKRDWQGNLEKLKDVLEAEPA